MDRYDITSEANILHSKFEDVFIRSSWERSSSFEFWSKGYSARLNAVAVDDSEFPDVAPLQQRFTRVDEQVTVVPIV